ncbi:ADR305Cp [Eremothecium gossypii ATCC 10895]|uniref:ADR305Cp n=1 Tax=Eremothecium gossypii (strain ATCC 10895 / CBS 109.51 / FGSC 9923 / NRRL Y-1056) TaxID=284811 RepID=Q759I3_EREGS|nr:ADR305Cp [Eremothecium gossypii ATCC 10895]AAS52225.2 ADR305Cp [Eremothecium gossypii ATCC 10895]AEY96524.1 FADR305Cp [Eremothecium gossypii FDAG1]
MSSRHVRRLAKDDLEATLAKLTGDTQPAKGTKKPQALPSQGNVFALFDAQDAEDEEEQVDAADKSSDVEQEARAPSVQGAASKKRNQRKKKKKNRQKAKPESDQESDGDFEEILREFQLKDAMASGPQEASQRLQSVSSDDEYDTASESSWTEGDIRKQEVMWDPAFTKFSDFTGFDDVFGGIEFKNLSPDTEFRALFGDLSPESVQDVDSMTSTHVSPQVLKQIQRMKRLVRNWGGKDRRSVPNGGVVRRLQFSKIKEDWLPTPRGEFIMTSLDRADLLDYEAWKSPADWADVLDVNVTKWQKHFSFYKFEPLSEDIHKKALTEFYLNVILHPDHEALINTISSKYPYHVPALLQVALILVRQGDSSNSNGLVERALFVFDRAIKNGIVFDGRQCQLPYIYFYNRQFYLAIFRYLQIISQRGAVGTASAWAKVLWSLSPLEDPLGVRYFIDHYVLLNKEYSYMLKLSRSSLVTDYRDWYTLGIALGSVVSHLHVSDKESARRELERAFKYHAVSLHALFTDVLLGSSVVDLAEHMTPTVEIEVKAYSVRMKAIWSDTALAWLHDEISNLLNRYHRAGDIEVVMPPSNIPGSGNHFFVDGIPIGLLRFAILSQESTVMAKIPERIWSSNEVFEFDVLPPKPTTIEFEDVVETINTFVKDDSLRMAHLSALQDEELLNQVRQLSLEQFLEQNPHTVMEDD